jgi:hypothetical protein
MFVDVRGGEMFFDFFVVDGEGGEVVGRNDDGFLSSHRALLQE